MKITAIGGDKRMLTAIKMLKKDFTVETVGLLDGDSTEISQTDVILLPAPTTRDKKTVCCPLTNREIPLSLIEENAESALVLTCGYMFKGVWQVDYSLLDSFAIKNAIPTAEGAIADAILNTKSTLFDSNILITGYGRVGKVLLSRLLPFSKNITVALRSERETAFLESLGIKHITTSEIKTYCENYNVIFNTLDIPLFDSGDRFENAILFDLSTMGCVNGTPYGLTLRKLPGLPGKCAPESAGKTIAETAKEIIRREF